MGLDRRDPQKLGEMLGKLRTHFSNTPFHELAVMDEMNYAPNYDLNETMQTVATEAYQQELKEKAAAGDRYAQRILDEQSASR